MKDVFLDVAKYIVGLFVLIRFKIQISRDDENLLKNNIFLQYRYLYRFSERKYFEYKQIIEQKNLKRIKDKSVVKIAFITYTSSIWFLDELYGLLKKNNCFEVSIIVGHENNDNREFDSTVDYFCNVKGYNVVKPAGINDFDILFYLTPDYFDEKELNIYFVALDKLIYNISYSYMLAGNMKKLDIDLYHWAYRYYTDSQYYFELISEKTKRYCGNAKYVGFPKMDCFYSVQTRRYSDKKTIIYAPHHSVNYTKFKSATFEKNYNKIIELAEKYKDTTYWVYKPHPLLRNHSVEAGIFSNYDEYDEYVCRWENMENASVVKNGEYLSVFKASDAMITDSVSFLAEYQFTKKPLLLLMSGEEEYNDFGESIVEVLYKCSGDDIENIEQFIDDVVEGRDEKKTLRNQFFEDKLDYMKCDNRTANQRIYADIINDIKEDGENI